MRLLVLSLALTLPSASALAADTTPARDMPVITPAWSTGSKECPPTSRYHMAKREGLQRSEAKRLTDLPMADLYMAVYRHVGACEAPIIARYGIGGEQR
jgi:hypothetical protein